ncbi:MAG: MarR family transcriptional regulator, partial [Cellulomonadaceae bacterium]|nr:MarR family transcriptional regulator [Cellulomonadaceae bacterium]
MRDLMAWAVLFQEAVARSGGLNGTDLQTVGLLMSEGPATPGELAERIGITSGGAITAVVDRLERAGYVTRRRDEHDRRRVIVSALPDVVMARVGPVYGQVAADWNAYLDTLTDEQLTFANDLIARAADVNRAAVGRLRDGNGPAAAT